MRVTNNMLINNMKKNLNMSLRRMDKIQNEMSSGKRIRVPSDDPVGTARSMKLRADLRANEQFRKNTDNVISWLETNESTLNQIMDVLHRAKERAVQGANGTYSDSDTETIAKEIEELRNQLVSFGNTTYVGRYIFSGFKTDTAPVQLHTDGSLDYQGDDGSIRYQVGVSDILSINMTAKDVFFNANGDDMLKDMEDMIDFLNAGDHAGIGSLIDNFEAHLENILQKTAQVGAKYSRMELVSNRLKDEELNLTGLLSKTEDADMADVIIRLTSEENVYQAALAAGARIIQPTLVDFLR